MTARSDSDPRRLVIVIRRNALKEAASMTSSRIGRLRMHEPDDQPMSAGDTIVLTDEDESFRVVAYIEATDQGFMTVNPIEIVSIGRSYRMEHPTPHGP